MPVIFVVVKSVGVKINSTIRSITSSRGTRHQSGHDPNDFVPLGGVAVSPSHQLPVMPKGKGNLRTLRSMLRIGNPTNAGDSIDDKIELTNVSVDRDGDSYHAHIKAGHQDKSYSENVTDRK